MKTPTFIAVGAAALITSLLPYLPEMAKTACLIASTVATCVHLQKQKRAKAASAPRRKRLKAAEPELPLEGQ